MHPPPLQPSSCLTTPHHSCLLQPLPPLYSDPLNPSSSSFVTHRFTLFKFLLLLLILFLLLQPLPPLQLSYFLFFILVSLLLLSLNFLLFLLFPLLHHEHPPLFSLPLSSPSSFSPSSSTCTSFPLIPFHS